MAWLLWVSFKRNWYKYWLAIIGLAAAVAVSSIGISAVDLMWQMSKYPVLHVIGGELLVLDNRVEFYGAPGTVRSSNISTNIIYSEISQRIKEALPGAQTTGTLALMAMHEIGSRATVGTIYGREDNTGKWMYAVTIMEGENLGTQNDGELVLVVPGMRQGGSVTGEPLGAERSMQLPIYNPADPNLWDLAGGTRARFTTIGIYKQPSHGSPMTSLKTLHTLTGAEDIVSFIGVIIPNPLAMAEAKNTLQKALAETHAELQVLSADDLGDLMIADFAKLQQTASYYTPVMILVSVLIVVVTALAMRQARKREMALLRTIGLDKTQVRILFIMECLFTALLGVMLGLAASWWLCSLVFGAYKLNVTPAVVSLVVTLGAAMLLAGGRRTEIAELLRNP